MLDPQKLRDSFKSKRYGAGEYDPDFDLLDAAADEIERLKAENERLVSVLRKAKKALIGNAGYDCSRISEALLTVDVALDAYL